MGEQQRKLDMALRDLREQLRETNARLEAIEDFLVEVIRSSPDPEEPPEPK